MADGYPALFVRFLFGKVENKIIGARNNIPKNREKCKIGKQNGEMSNPQKMPKIDKKSAKLGAPMALFINLEQAQEMKNNFTDSNPVLEYR